MFGRAGFDQGLGDGIGGRGSLLPSEQCDGVGSECRERTSLDTSARADHATQRARYEEPQRDPLRERHHLQLDAGKFEFIQSSARVGSVYGSGRVGSYRLGHIGSN